MKQLSTCGKLLAPLLMFTVTAAALADQHEEEPAPTVVEQILALEAMCAADAEAAAERSAEKSLYERLGGEEGIHAFIAETVRLHNENETIKHLMKGVDSEHLVKMVTQFIVDVTGGTAEYTGSSMVDAHAHMELTNEHFLAAGGDIMQAMKTNGAEETEIHEFICIFVSLRAEVVIESEKILEQE